jgi:1-acyl-sn-glycerol-3-phosphate acyltransferase
MPEYAWNALRTASRQYMKGRAELRIEGEEHLPTKGPSIIAARHYHHLYDGAAMMMTVPHPLHILVGLDWIRNPALRVLMNSLCDAAGWPVVLRRDGQARVDDAKARQALKRAYKESLELLRRGHSLLIFPEGYPNIDPGYTPKSGPDDFLPFQPGFARVATGAARSGIAAPIVPAGFSYVEDERWRITLRFGAPVYPNQYAKQADLVTDVELTVRRLSGL